MLELFGSEKIPVNETSSTTAPPLHATPEPPVPVRLATTARKGRPNLVKDKASCRCDALAHVLVSHPRNQPPLVDELSGFC